MTSTYKWKQYLLYATLTCWSALQYLGVCPQLRIKKMIHFMHVSQCMEVISSRRTGQGCGMLHADIQVCTWECGLWVRRICYERVVKTCAHTGHRKQACLHNTHNRKIEHYWMRFTESLTLQYIKKQLTNSDQQGISLVGLNASTRGQTNVYAYVDVACSWNVGYSLRHRLFLLYWSETPTRTLHSEAFS